MNYFQSKVTVDVHDVDFNGVAKCSSMMKYIQSAAELQLAESGKSYDVLKSQHRAFVLSKIKMEFSDTVKAYEPLDAVTYPATSRGFSFLRCYKLVRDGVTVGRAVGVWALIDTAKHSLVRVNDFDLGLTTYEPIDLPICRIVIPDGMCEVGKFQVGYAEADQNMHMNNTRYPDVYCRFLPMAKNRIESITINYLKEAAMGELLTVESVECDGLYYFRTLCRDGSVNSEAEIKLCKI